MRSDEKILKLIVSLNRATATGELQWRIDDAPRSLVRGTDDVIPLYFTGRYRQQHFGLFERRYKAFSIETEQTYWTSEIVLVLVDIMDRVLWETSSDQSALRDLHKAVQRKCSNIDQLLDDLLSGPEA
jgi:hypothetical protein